MNKDLSDSSTKAYLKNTIGFDQSKFAQNVDLTSSKPEVDRLDNDKLEKLSTGLNCFKSEVDEFDLGI